MYSINNELVNGYKWNLINVVFNFINNFIITAILARLLDPKDFGLMGIILIFVGLASIFSDFGLSTSIVQNKKIGNNQINTINFLNILLGVVITLITFFSSNYIALYFKESILSRLLKLISIVFVLQSISLIYKAILQKNMAFKSLAINNLLSQFTKSLVSVVLAYIGFGVYSLVWGLIMSTLVESLLFLFFYGRLFERKWGLYLRDVHEQICYGVYLFGYQVINYLVNNLDKLLIGKVFGPKELGIYTIVTTLINIPRQNINPIVIKPIFPILSKFQNRRNDYKIYFEKGYKLVGLYTLPLMMGLFVTADEFIKIIYGEQWIDAVTPLKMMCFLGILRAFINYQSVVFLSQGKTNIMFFIDLLSVPLTIVTVLVFKDIGIIGIAYSYIVTTLIVYIIQIFIINKVILNDLRAFFIPNKHPLFAAFGMVLIVKMTNLLLNIDNIFFKLCVDVMIGLIAFTIFMCILNKNFIRDIKMFKNNF